MKHRRSSLILRGVFVAFVLQAHASGFSQYVTVPEPYSGIARAHGIPPTLIYAVALAESGKYVTRLQTTQPWPWTLNIAGEGRYYPSREAAIEDARQALAGGVRSVDFGLMQVNWGYHKTALRSVESAIDPVYNLEVGARILAGCYQARGDWWAAVGCYHAPANAERAARYRDRVSHIWTRVTAAE